MNIGEPKRIWEVRPEPYKTTPNAPAEPAPAKEPQPEKVPA